MGVLLFSKQSLWNEQCFHNHYVYLSAACNMDLNLNVSMSLRVNVGSDPCVGAGVSVGLINVTTGFAELLQSEPVIK